VSPAASKDVNAAAKQQPNKGGYFFPINGCQKFDGANADFENGAAGWLACWQQR
jgi:hypothetical protein